ncbi:MAG: DNA internalization-related competence protein ComEC/Rec2 [Lachnospiraceae bacterium]|nr:DNA internalization-related competence protein ComEC/Rec2 [Lachnospiraceae bacterium]
MREGNLGQILFYPKEDRCPVGSVLAAEAKTLDWHTAENEGEFDEREYYLSMGIVAKCSEEKLLLLRTPLFSWGEALFRLRQKMTAVYQNSLTAEEPGLLSMMTLGDRSLSDPEVKDLFAEAGLSHIFAISGLHISVVGAGVYTLLRRRRHSILLSSVVGVALVLCYAAMVGASVSSVRAAGMFAALMLAGTMGWIYDSVSALSVMCLLLLWQEPFACRQSSFIFSFSAVLALTFAANTASSTYEKLCEMRWEQTHKRGKGRRWHIQFHERVLSALIWGIFMQLGTLPILAYFYFSIPVYVIILNLILLPFLGILLAAGLLGGLVGIFSAAGGAVLLAPCHYILYYYEMMADFFTGLTGSSQIAGRPSLFVIPVYYLLLYAVMRRLSTWLNREVERHRLAIELPSGRVRHQRQSFGMRKVLFQTAPVLFGMVSLLFLHPDPGFEVDMLYVGQGDGIFINSGMGEHYFIDGGSTSEQELGRYTLLPFLKSRGIASIDVWFLTHMDLDHISGFMEAVKKGYRIRTLILAKSLERTEAYTEIVRLCEEHKIRILYMRPGDKYQCESRGVRIRKLAFVCLAPEDPPVFEGANENSLVLALHYEEEPPFGKRSEKKTPPVFGGVFTGDMGTEQEEALVKAGGDLFAADGKVELLKSGHHGSNHSNCSEWLSMLDPELVIISAGRNNRYHHPGQEALERMDALGLAHLCTIDTGQISVRWENGCLKVRKYLEDPS